MYGTVRKAWSWPQSSMANGSLIFGVKRVKFVPSLSRFMATRTTSPVGKLRSEILKLKPPKANAFSVLQSWAEQGNTVSISYLRSIYTQLVKIKRYQDALEIFSWVETRKGLRFSVADCTVKLELIIKVHGLKEGETFFTSLPDSASKKAACLPLLHGYVRERDTDSAEALMVRLSELGLIVDAHPYNEMMKLYVVTSQYHKVRLVIQQMKRNRVALNVLSYNIWMNACGEQCDVVSVEMAFREMQCDGNVELGWSSLATLANVYIKAGLVEKAAAVLKVAERKLSPSKRLGYNFLMTMYVSLNNKEGVLRLWEASKAVDGRITCADYMCILSSLVKVCDFDNAERIFAEWEADCRNYDIRVSNVLLGAYVRNGMIDNAVRLHHQTVGRGGSPNHKTWEILMEGFVKSYGVETSSMAAMERALEM